MHPADVFAEIIKLDPRCKRVTLTGGEPLEQDTEELIELLVLLHRQRYEVSIETNGMQIDKIKSIQKALKDEVGGDGIGSWNISYISDFKLPSSGNPWNQIVYGGVAPAVPEEEIIKRNIAVWVQNCGWSSSKSLGLGGNDFIKFVIADKEDFKWAMYTAKLIIEQHPWYPKCYFSPCGLKAPGLLFDWMKEASCAEKDIGYSMQIHKVIFPGDWRDEEK
jgi:hypothetical protein